MFSIFRRSAPKVFPAFDFIGVDMHNHLLPGIDDGSPDPETSVTLLEKMQELGYHAFNCTPHVISDVHPNNPQTISAAFDTLKMHLKEIGKKVPMHFAAEYMVNFDFDEMLAQNNMLHFGQDKKYVLIEMSYAVESPNIRDAVFELILKGYQPVLAHPERYPFYHNPNLREYEKLVDGGCELQVNMLSLGGYYGPPQKEFAQKLIDRGWVNWLGSDLHHERHIEALTRLANDKKAMKYMHKIKDLRNPSLQVAQAW